MELHLQDRRGVASVIGTMLFVFVLMAGLGAVAYVYSLQAQSSQAAQQAQQLLNQHGKESLTFQALSGGTLAVANTGSSGSTVKYVILKFANGSVYQFAPNQSVGSGSVLSIPSLIPSQSCGLSTCLSKYATILNSTNSGDSVGVVTSLGNVFWEKPALSVQGSTPGTTVQTTFLASGDSAFALNPVLVVDGTSYTQSQLPVTVTWFVGTKHAYAWQALAQGTGTRVAATVTGLEQSPSGTITATSDGSIAATFTTQYLLTMTGGSGVTVNPSSPTGDGYYPAGTGVQITAPNVWNSVAGQSRSNLVSYSLDGGSPSSVTRSDTGNFVYSLTMNNPHTMVFNAVTQYYVVATPGVPSGGSVNPLSISYSYIGAQTITPTSNTWNIAQQTCSGCATSGYSTVSISGGSASFSEGASCGSGSCYEQAIGEVDQELQNPPVGATYTSVSFSINVGVSEYIVGGYAGANICVWVSGGSEDCGTGSGTYTSTWTGSTTSVPYVYIEASASAVYVSGYGGGYGIIDAGVGTGTWTITYSGPISGTTTSTSNTFSVSGGTVTYSYGVGYAFPGGSTSTSWYANFPFTETYSSNTCSGSTVSGTELSSAASGTCTLQTTYTGSYSISLTSPTNDGWFDSGTTVSISTSPTGPFTFSSWGASSGGLVIASSTTASTTVTVNTYGTITANYYVNQ